VFFQDFALSSVPAVSAARRVLPTIGRLAKPPFRPTFEG
jgi:hypothetical protein